LPIYEYTCAECKQFFELHISFSEYDSACVLCPRCGSTKVLRKIRAPRMISDDSKRLVTESSMESGDDPAALGRTMRQLQQESGEALPAEYDEVISRLEDGQSLSEIDSHFAADDGDF
jgi:putative FmdB family regulatory protein